MELIQMEIFLFMIKGNRINEPIDHDGYFTLINGEVLGVGSQLR